MTEIIQIALIMLAALIASEVAFICHRNIRSIS